MVNSWSKNNGILNRGEFTQCNLNFCWFYSEPPDLNLRVISSQMFKNAIITYSTEIPGAVNTLLFFRGILRKTRSVRVVDWTSIRD